MKAMSRPRRRWLIIGSLVAAAAVVSALVVLSIPNSVEPSGATLIDFRFYSFESVSLFNKPAWQNYTYKGVTFEFHLWCLASPAAGELCGNATEANGAIFPYSFSDGPPTWGPPPWQTWVSPDYHEAVQYQTGGLAHLMVLD